jgi:hypothetical protein
LLWNYPLTEKKLAEVQAEIEFNNSQSDGA